jgi:hypothetical protein
MNFNGPAKSYLSEPAASPECPSGFAHVPSDANLGTTAFCVARFEMKAVKTSDGSLLSDGGSDQALGAVLPSAYRAEVRADGSPWIGLTSLEASTACMVQGWELISNPQWQAVARNLESNKENWTEGAVGYGVMYRGHTDNSPAANLPVSSTTNDYTDTLNNSSNAVGSGAEQRRTLYLTTGEAVWDFSGNVAEILSTLINAGGIHPGLTNLGPFEFDSTYFDFQAHPVSRLLFAPLGANPVHYTSAHGMGMLYGGSTGGITRGSGRTAGFTGGIFYTRLDGGPYTRNAITGFRCITQPE